MMKSLKIDFHADTLYKKLFSQTTQFISGKFPFFHFSKEKMQEGDLDLQVLALFVPTEVVNLSVEITMKMIALAYKMRDLEGFQLIKNKKDIQELQNNDDLGIMLSIEGAIILENNIELLQLFYELGVRSIGLAWSRKNNYAQGVPYETNGVSDEGKLLIEELDNLGIIIDVSHLNKKGFFDVVNITNNPFIASHSNSYSLCSSMRNLMDDQLEAIQSVEGVIGINFNPGFLNNKPENASIKDVINHIDYITNKIGSNHVGLGSDFDGIIKVPLGLEDVSKLKLIPKLLSEGNYSQKDIRSIMGGNFQRVISKVWKK